MMTDFLRCGLFASRDSYNEAMAYAYTLIETLQGSDRVAALTALHVVLNAVADELDRKLEAQQ